MLKRVSELISQLDGAIGGLEASQQKTAAIEDVVKQAKACRDDLIPAMQAVRTPADELEMIVDAEIWPLPTYAEMLFTK